MRKDASKKRYSEKRAAKYRLRRIIYLVLGLILLGSIGAGIYHYKEQPYFVSLKKWFAERKNHLQTNMVKVKQLAANKEAPPEPIHFEFYTALPNMHIERNTPKPPLEKVENDK